MHPARPSPLGEGQRRRRGEGFLALALLLLAGCVDYNEDCTPLVDHPDEVVGMLAQDVDITKQTVRTSDNLVGQLVAEAYANEGATEGSAGAQVGMENSGAIRSDGVCTDHSSLPAGPVLKKTLREVLAFDDTVGLISIEPDRLKKVFEHSVATFVDATKTVANTPSGQFLQISGVRVHVDCTLPAETSSADGQRVTMIELVKHDDQGNEVATTIWDGTTYQSTDRIRIATNSFLLGGGSGFGMLAGLDSSQTNPASLPGLNFQITARWFQKTYDGSKDKPALGTKGGVTHRPPGGWVLSNCK